MTKDDKRADMAPDEENGPHFTVCTVIFDGTMQRNTWNCPRCGEKYLSTRFCPKCGARRDGE